MNQRERTLMLAIIVMVALLGNFYLAKRYMDSYKQKVQKLADIESSQDRYQSSATVAAGIKDEIDWLEKSEPEPSTYQQTQSDLESFLSNTSKNIGFSTYAQKLIPLEGAGGEYERVKIEISAKATEAQIYQWLVNIHQPDKFRALTYLRLIPSNGDDGMVVCTITAEQWLVAAESE